MASSTTKDHLPATAPVPVGPSFSSSSSSAAQLAEDESRKKNTDCVYFLASPLTCKKGNECEYRHSEYARVNPRDCYFWLNGNCLNPKCSFRHPPLDTLLGAPVDGSAGSSVPGSSGAAAGSSLPPSQTVPSALYMPAKSAAPCIYFQKGYCLKGDRCPFSHMQNPTSNKTSVFPAANASEPSSLNNGSGGIRKCSQLKIAPQVNVSKPTEAIPPQPKTSVQAVKAAPRNGAFAEKRGMPHNVLNDDLPSRKEVTLHSLNNGNSRNKSGSAFQASSVDEQRFQSGKEVDDLLRESSPGFDVLVDDELRDEEYYGNEDKFPGIQGHRGRNFNDFEIGRPDGYNSVDDVDPVIHYDRHGYDKYKSMQDRHAQDHTHTSSERSVIEGSHYDRRGVYKGVSPDGIRNSDLRHRLSKQRRVNGLSSVVNPGHASDILAEEHSYRIATRDSHHAPPPSGSSFSSRLQGRLKLPRQSSTVNPPSMHSEREYDKGRDRARLSPSRPQLHSHQGRLQDRLRGRIPDDIGRDATPKREILDNYSFDFAAPKTLAELRRAKQSSSHSQELPKRSEELASVGKRKGLDSSQHIEDDLSFEGPKPLSEILKRKRKAEATDSLISGTEEESKRPEPKGNAAVEKENKLNEDPPLVESKQEANVPTHAVLSKPAAKESESKSLNSNGKTKLTETEMSQANNASDSKEGLGTQGVEDHELEDEYYEEGEEGYEDEQGDGEGEAYDLEEGENGEVPDDYMDEDDGDNFAKKIGVVFG